LSGGAGGIKDGVGFSLTSTAFDHEGRIPARHSCEGEDVSPPLAWAEVPEGTASLALICDDPDAPSGTFVHWVAWGIEPASGGLGEGESPPSEGTGGFGEAGYRGPCPPPGHGPHRYFFRLFALDSELELAPSASREELEAAMEGNVVGDTLLLGTYER
jgi:Raf kinase inhibitor-like YbhB/YbcL family protein